MATSNLPRRRSVSRVREGQRTSWLRNIFGRERKAAGRRSFLLVRTSNILIGQWLYTRRNVIRETMCIFFSFSFSVHAGTVLPWKSSRYARIMLGVDDNNNSYGGVVVSRMPRRWHRDSLSRRLWDSRGYRAPGDRAKMILRSANQCLCRAAKPRWWRLRVAKVCASHR